MFRVVYMKNVLGLLSRRLGSSLQYLNRYIRQGNLQNFLIPFSKLQKKGRTVKGIVRDFYKAYTRYFAIF